MKEQRITLTIDPDGRIVADADGFTGGACLQELDRLLEGVVGTSTARARKPDAAVATTTARRVTAGKKP